jgi:hypothetical protein
MTTMLRSQLLLSALVLGLFACQNGSPEVYPPGSGGNDTTGSGGSGEGGSTGSNNGSGGSSSGGSQGSGGAVGSGGNAGSGGVQASGGHQGSGGAASGGVTGSGGNLGKGGVQGSGGTVGLGGSNGSGGSTSASKDGGASDAGGSVSFSKQILPLLTTNCGSCHTGSNPNAGINVGSYSTVKSSANSINSAIQNGIMPPSGPLSSSDKQLMQSWISAGTPNN